jgi:hypothetical protein
VDATVANLTLDAVIVDEKEGCIHILEYILPSDTALGAQDD